MNKLGAFIRTEIEQRNLSASEFARLVGTSHTTINRLTSDAPPEPKLSFLVKLAEATSVDLCTLVLLAVGNHPAPNLDAQVLADRIEALPPELRDMVDTFIYGVLLKKGQNPGNE